MLLGACSPPSWPAERPPAPAVCAVALPLEQDILVDTLIDQAKRLQKVHAVHAAYSSHRSITQYHTSTIPPQIYFRWHSTSPEAQRQAQRQAEDNSKSLCHRCAVLSFVLPSLPIHLLRSKGCDPCFDLCSFLSQLGLFILDTAELVQRCLLMTYLCILSS